MHVRRTDAALVTVHAPAKINLFLEVRGRRADGFHEIETLMAGLSLGDTLVFAQKASDGVEFECRWGHGTVARFAAAAAESGSELDVPTGPDNLAWRAIELLRLRAGDSPAGQQRGAKVLLVKRIPAAAGLGGASSDAAAALVAANIGWELHWPHERLSALAAELGSDVPFFLTSGAANCRGRGELIERVRLPRMHVVVVRPPVGLSTPAVYRACQPAEKPSDSTPLVAALALGNVAGAARHLVNRLQAPAATLTPWIDRLQAEFSRVDCLGHQMSGSGSSYFGLCRSARHARRQAIRLRGRNLGVGFAATTSVG